jgi:hypothetical protein
MPFLSDAQVKELLALAAGSAPELLAIAAIHGVCNECGRRTAQDYCRTCDEFYWLHAPGCLMYEDKHFGHRLTIVPFVEERNR